MLVEVVHRKYNAARDRPEFFSVPFMVPVAEWMFWNDVVDVINSEAERFIDRVILPSLTVGVLHQGFQYGDAKSRRYQ